jgi:hypothetical protein
LLFTLKIYTVVRAPRDPWTAPGVVNDVTQMNPVVTTGIVTPKTTDDIVEAVKRHAPISIGGARHSMGGQIAASGSLHLDLRGFDRILEFWPEAKSITVQAGTRWRQIQERIDPADLSVAIMQSYANFTVGARCRSMPTAATWGKARSSAPCARSGWCWPTAPRSRPAPRRTPTCSTASSAAMAAWA